MAPSWNLASKLEPEMGKRLPTGTWRKGGSRQESEEQMTPGWKLASPRCSGPPYGCSSPRLN